MTSDSHGPDVSDRQAHAEATFTRLFGPRDVNAPEDDPELMSILRGFIFGDVFDTGVLDDRARELVTVTVLACLQTLPQLKAHTAAALNVGVEPIEIREAVYQLAPFIGFPRTLNAVATINEALPRFLTEFCFGDFYTRGGLSLAQRELLVLCALATIGDTSAQLGPHARACIQVGNSTAYVIAALVHCFPYIGFPRAVAAIRAVKSL